MSDYEIHIIENDEPYVVMHGDFSADELHEILEEMLIKKNAVQKKEPWACDNWTQKQLRHY